MTVFRTIVDSSPSLELSKISHTSKTVLIGSCFTESIGGKLHELKFPVDINPCGIVYNPRSVENTLRFLLEQKEFTEADLRSHNGRWFSLYHHSQFSNTVASECLQGINHRIEQGAEFLAGADHLILTFGTAWVYELKETGDAVSNCHKLPSNDFNRHLLDVKEIVDRYKVLLKSLYALNPKISVVFTVSPVRHLKDGAHGNQVSKSTLLLAVERLISDFIGDCVTYFPAYEILLDDLRDYRFYADDMVHPTGTAVDYIWEKFTDAYISDDSRSLIKNIADIIAATNHRPFDAQSSEHRRFCDNQINKIEALLARYPDLKFQEELNYFNNPSAIANPR